MIKVVDISEFQTAFNDYRKNRRDVNSDSSDDEPVGIMLANKVGIISTVLGALLLLIGCILECVYGNSEFYKFIVLILAFVCTKYILGGFGGRSPIITTIKLLLSLCALYLYLCMLDPKVELGVDTLQYPFSSESKWMIILFMLASGIVFGASLYLYLKPKVEGAELEGTYLYSRFTAGVSAGIGVAFSLLYLALASLSPSSYAYEYDNNEEVIASNIYQEAEEATVSESDPLTEAGNAAVRDLYRMFYSTALFGKNEYGDPYYSEALKAKFKELNITKGIDEPYSKSFRKEFYKVSEMEQLTGSLILDSDPLWNSQGDIGKVNLEVTKVDPIDENHVRVYAKFNNYGNSDRDFYLIKENGTFKIDDMDGCRAYFKEEIESSKKYLEELKQQESQQSENIYPEPQTQQGIEESESL